MDAARLPQVVKVEGLIVRSFPAERATARLSKSERRSLPAVIRRVYAAASRYVAEECLICEAPAPIEGRVLIAIETDGDQTIGCICGGCAR